MDGLWYMDYVDPDEAFVIKHSKEDYLDSLKDIVRKGLTNVNPNVRLKYEWLEQKLAAI